MSSQILRSKKRITKHKITTPQHATKMEEYFTFTTRKDASFDFITDLILQKLEGSCEPSDHGYKNPKLTILTAHLGPKIHEYESVQFDVCQLQLIDGSNTIIKAVTDTSLSDNPSLKNLVRGATISITDFSVIWLNSDDKLEWRAMILIRDFTVDAPGIHDEQMIVSHASINTNNVESRIVFGCRFENIVEYDPDRKEKLVDDCSIFAFDNGAWIAGNAIGKKWMEMVAKTQELIKNQGTMNGIGACDCQTRFGLDHCVLIQLPIEEIDEDALFTCCEKRSKMYSNDDYDELGYEEWSDLPPQSRRWGYNWWYATNVFHTNKKRIELPDCLTSKLQSSFPNSHEYNGKRKHHESV